MVPDLFKSQAEPPLRQPLIEEVPQINDEMGIIQRQKKDSHKEEKKNERKDRPSMPFRLRLLTKGLGKSTEGEGVLPLQGTSGETRKMQVVRPLAVGLLNSPSRLLQT